MSGRKIPPSDSASSLSPSISLAPEGTILKISRFEQNSLRKKWCPRVIALYNHAYLLFQQSEWRDTYQLPPLAGTYFRWHQLSVLCQEEGIAPEEYLTWIFSQQVLRAPHALLAFSMSSGVIWRYKKSLSQKTSNSPCSFRFGPYGNRLIDDRTGEQVSWIFNRAGEPLLSPPRQGEVYDQKGNPIFLRRRI